MWGFLLDKLDVGSPTRLGGAGVVPKTQDSGFNLPCRNSAVLAFSDIPLLDSNVDESESNVLGGRHP